MLPPQFQPSADGTKVDPQVIQAQQMMEQMATQMEQMAQQVQMMNHQNQLLVDSKEREWYEAQTKRMDVEGKIMMTDAQLQAAVRENLMTMMSAGSAEVMESNRELEEVEEALTAQQMQPAQQPQQQQQPAMQGQAPSVGTMRRQPDVQALTGEAKPGESNE
jgi:arylamine N-acetyltransferase